MAELFDHPYASFLQRVAKPNRYTGREHGARVKDWAETATRVCLAFPDIYDIGMSHLGFRILYKLLNDQTDVLAERCYTPWIDLQAELRSHGQLLCALESGRPLCDFDVVGFSLQFELTFTNILTMLDLGGIPLRAEDRSDDDPLIVVGGPVATHMEPLALFVDCALIGDGEEATTEIARLWTDGKRRGLSRQQRLIELAQLQGVYVPSLYETAVDSTTGFEVVTGARRDPSGQPLAPFPIERRLVEDISAYPFPDDGPVGGPEAIFDRMSIEVARGCTEGCRFCQAGMIYRPVRERDLKTVIDTVMKAIEKSGQDEVSLTALSTADVSCISPLIKQLVEKTAPKRVSLGVASLRAYGLAEDLLDDMKQVRASGLTFAPEAGTQRMRDVINKNVTEAQLMETAERVFKRGYDRMKLYFIIGLPTEQDEDVLGIMDVGVNAFDVGRRVTRGRKPKVTVSVSVHVPKPHTPFQWCAMDDETEVDRKQAMLKDAVRPHRGITLRMHDCQASILEGIIARGDRSLGRVIERAYLGGARYDSWDDQLRLDVWQEAFEHFDVETSKFLSTIPVDARLPWDHFDIGLEDGFLAREYRKALKSRLSPPCGKAAGMFVHHTNTQEAEADQRRLVCYDCGVACDMSDMRAKRVGFLERMDATVPGKRAQLPIVQAEPGQPKKRQRPEALRPPQTGGPAERWRLKFVKTGPVALLGHLDLIRELPRALRRAGLQTAYSQGYHPKPILSFTPALALGSASVAEYLDAKLVGAPDADQLLKQLNAACAGGLEFIAATKLTPLDPGLNTVITSATYILALSELAVAERGGRDWLSDRIGAFLAEQEVIVHRNVKGIGKKIDVRAKVLALSIGDQDAADIVERAGVVGRLVPVVVTVSLDANGSVKMPEVTQAVFGDAAFPCTPVRAEINAGAHTPLALSVFRKPAPKSKTAPVSPTA